MGAHQRLWANLALAVLAPLAFFGLLEILLRFAGVKPLALTEDPFVGFSSSQPLFLEATSPQGEKILTTSPPKLEHFNRQSFPRAKAPGTYRIFVLGGSTAYGHPWRDPTSFAGWLRELLPEADAARKWEVINAGGISYASYREAKLVEELCAYQPDLFVVYSGHNEFLEERTYRKASEMPAIAREVSAWLDRTRTYTALRLLLRKLKKNDTAGSGNPGNPRAPFRMQGEVDDVLARTIGPTSYVRDDALRKNVLDHYRVSLDRMARLAHAAGAEVLFLTTPGNEKDCSPFKSEITPGIGDGARAEAEAWWAKAQGFPGDPVKALEAYDSALARDPRNAGLLYRAGQAAFAAGKRTEAKGLFRRALDEDICPLRALTSMRGIVREAAEANHARWLDITGLLESRTREREGHDILGEPDFVDHVHLSIEDYRLLALSILDEMVRMGAVHPSPDWGEAKISRVTAKVMGKVDDKVLGEGWHNLAKVINWAGKHEDAARIAERGLLVDSNGLEAIWSSLFVGAAREREGKSGEAIPHYRRAVRLDPKNPLSRHYLAAALMRRNENVEAAAEFEAVLELDPGDLEARESLGRLYLGMGRFQQAAPHLAKAREARPQRAELGYLLGEALVSSGHAGEAEAEYRHALEIDPRLAKALVGLGKVAESRGNPGAAIEFYARALSMQPDLPEAQRALGNNLLKMPSAGPVPAAAPAARVRPAPAAKP